MKKKIKKSGMALILLSMAAMCLTAHFNQPDLFQFAFLGFIGSCGLAAS